MNEESDSASLVELSTVVIRSDEDDVRSDGSEDEGQESISSTDSDYEEDGDEYEYDDDDGDERENRNKVALATGVIKRPDTSNLSRTNQPMISSSDEIRKGRFLKWAFLIFRHPISRNVLPFVVLALNFLIFNEDPISYSHQESKVYIVGRVLNYFFRQYPPLDEGLWITLKVFSLLLWVVLGILLGKYFVHDALLRDLCQLKLFQKDMGSWPVMTLTTAFVIYGGSFVYNAIISNHFHLQDGSKNDIYVLNDYIGIKEFQYGVIAATMCWFCDYFNIFVINDSMLQDAHSIVKRRKKYGCSPMFARKMQHFWDERRKTVFYVTTFLMFAITFFYVGSNYEYGWMMDKKGHFFWNQYGRSFLCSFILALDLCMFMQDWDFPKFKRGGKNVKILGCNDRCGCRSRRFEYKLQFNGKWINFGALFVLIVLDTNLFFNQALYAPGDYLQLADENNLIRNVFNEVPFDWGFLNGTEISASSSSFWHYDDGGTLRPPDKFTYNFTSPKVYGNKSAYVNYVHCFNETTQKQKNDTEPSIETLDYKCFNVSEPFKIKFVSKNDAVMVASAIPVVAAFCFCCVVICFIFYNNGRCCGCCMRYSKKKEEEEEITMV